MSWSISASPVCHLAIVCRHRCWSLTGRVVWHEDRYERAGLNLLDERAGRVAPCISRLDHGIDGHPQSLLGTVSRVVDRFSRRPPDHEDIQVMRWRAGPLEITGCPRAKDQDPLLAIQLGE